MITNMTQEDKELLLIDVCARLPYKVKYKDAHGYIEILDIGKGFHTAINHILHDNTPCIYLRPMSSMTEEELKTFYKIEDMEHPVIWNIPQPNWHFSVDGIDWLLSKQFDFRGLIEKGLAIEAPEGMYDSKKK